MLSAVQLDKVFSIFYKCANLFLVLINKKVDYARKLKDSKLKQYGMIW